MKQILLIFFPCILLLWACPPCNNVSTNNGTLSAMDLALIPYNDYDTIVMEHSGGLKISFSVQRKTEQTESFCEECCNSIIYETDQAILTPDYPIFSIGTEISNFDTNYTFLNLHIGKSFFGFPYDTLVNKPLEQQIINDNVYKNVFKLKSNYGSAYDTDSIYADSLYYSIEKGIILIKMSNFETYTLHE